MLEFRIRYNAEKSHSEVDNYHYYMADSAIQALDFHNKMIKRKRIQMQTISVERYCKYSEKWFDESEVLKEHDKLD